MNWASQVVLVVKNLLVNTGDIRDAGSILALGRSPEEGMATHSTIPDQRISVDTGTWRTAVHEAAELDMTE